MKDYRNELFIIIQKIMSWNKNFLKMSFIILKSMAIKAPGQRQ